MENSEITKLLDEYAALSNLKSEPVTIGPFTMVFRTLKEEEEIVRDRYLDPSNSVTAFSTYIDATLAASLYTINGKMIEEYCGLELRDPITKELKPLGILTAERINAVKTKVLNKFPREVRKDFYEQGCEPLEVRVAEGVEALSKKKLVSLEDSGEESSHGLLDENQNSITVGPTEI